MDQIASDIVQHGVSTPHTDNRHLEPTTAISERTVRHENPDLDRAQEPTRNVPLPKVEPVEDDVDL